MPIPLEQWRQEVSAHLDKIEAGAAMCEAHAKELAVRPDFETRAEVELELCAMALQAALARVRRARMIYRNKEVGT